MENFKTIFRGQEYRYGDSYERYTANFDKNADEREVLKEFSLKLFNKEEPSIPDETTWWKREMNSPHSNVSYFDGCYSLYPINDDTWEFDIMRPYTD